MSIKTILFLNRMFKYKSLMNKCYQSGLSLVTQEDNLKQERHK